MPTDRPPAPRSSARRAPAAPTKIPGSTPPTKAIPYVAAAAVLAAVVFAMRSAKYSHVGALAAGLLAMALLGYVAISSRDSLPRGDRLRILLPIVAIFSLVCAAIPYTYTLYPPAPRGTVELRALGSSGSVNVTYGSATVWLSVRGAFNRNASGSANYFLAVTRDGGPSERVDGTLRAQAGGPAPEQHILGLRGPGNFLVRLEQVSESVALPLRVDIHAKPFSTLILILLYSALTAAIVAIDVMLWRRGLEPSFAASLLLPLVAVTYFQLKPVSDSLSTDLLASGIIGALGGGFGGEILGRIGRMMVRKE